ncbi:MAG: MalY/PatB family protein [Bacillota bacterium]|nr:MalY/PatB family protein [Bacillota bacterium]
MKYDFDKVIERKGTNSAKWDQNQTMFGREDVLDMWVADMDFPCPAPVVEAVRRRAEHPIYGYTFPSSSLYEAIIERTHRHFGWKIRREWIVFTAGVVNGLYSVMRAFAHPGDEVVVQPPVYYPFFSAVANTGCQIVRNPLVQEDGRYRMDFTGLEELFKPVTTFPVRSPRIRMLVLCSPHNPVGRVWEPDELATLAEICLRNNCLIISDEIHCDLLFKGAKHTVTSTLSAEIERRTITLMAPSKTFNLAGLGTSYVIIPDDNLRREYVRSRAGMPGGNLFGYAALEAAYQHGDDYLDQLREYLNGNLSYFMGRVEAEMPELKVVMPEGTYLAWVDMRGLGLGPMELQTFIRNKARLALDDGYAFGPGGEGFQRINLGCPRSIIKEGLDRLSKAVRELRKA